jgi:IS5 family transposase
VILRLLVLQHRYAWSFEQVEQFVNDSLVLRQFCRLGLDRVTELARSLKVTRGRKLRIDSTVVSTTIHHPSDRGLLADGVRVLSRLVRQAGDLLARGTEPLFRDRTRSAKRLMRRIQASAAVTGRGAAAAAADRTELYRRLLEITRTSLQQAETVQRLLATRTGAALERVRAQVEHFVPLVQRVCTQTQRRVVGGEQVPAADKLVSLFEPHTAVIRRGKLPVPTEFGAKLLLDEVDGGLVSRYVVLEGNPPDAPQLPVSLDHHWRQFGQSPHTAAADRAFSTSVNEDYATQAGVSCVAIPHTGKCSAQRRAWEQRPAFRRAARFGAGIEGRISVLKRRFGLRRCRYHGRTGMERWVGWGILAHNLRQISRSVAARRAV